MAVSSVRRRLLEAPEFRAWLEALAAVGRDPFSLDYWYAVELMARGVDGFFLPYELHMVCGQLDRIQGSADEWRLWPPRHVIERPVRRQRGPSPKTIELAARALIARFAYEPTRGSEPLSAQLMRAAEHATDADLAAEAAVLSPVVLDSPTYRGGEQARKARERVRRLQSWSTWGLNHPGQPWRREVA